MDILFVVRDYYIFDRGYNNFAQLYRIHTIGACFVIRAKNNVKYRVLCWKRNLEINLNHFDSFINRVYSPQSCKLPDC